MGGGYVNIGELEQGECARVGMGRGRGDVSWNEC